MKKDGFTLIEVLLVTVILFFLAFATYQAVRATVRSKENIDALSTDLQPNRAILGLLERDLRSSVHFTDVDFVFQKPAKRSDQTDEDYAAEQRNPAAPVAIFQGKESELFLTTRTHQRMARDLPENEQAFVTYQLQGENLIRAESLRAVHVNDQSSPEEYRKFVVISKVRKLVFRYWDSTRNEWVSSWDTERTETKDRLPSAVDIDLQFESELETDPVRVLQLRSAVTLAQSLLKRVPPPPAPVVPPSGGNP
jgi:type II secretion system protein J